MHDAKITARDCERVLYEVIQGKPGTNKLHRRRLQIEAKLALIMKDGELDVGNVVVKVRHVISRRRHTYEVSILMRNRRVAVAVCRDQDVAYRIHREVFLVLASKQDRMDGNLAKAAGLELELEAMRA